ncbi:hypothetical protein EW026_g7737 [Hermanssonia centrifuga]|uniref:Uncharacterized protein n=1 Tax=Hermanssonia centrifuga TaxID=98765 RepID=A0A4S4K7U9_9APHY|nr:hypothetical protein EW026_g7737 [Hermanssonia centrifuga]
MHKGLRVGVKGIHVRMFYINTPRAECIKRGGAHGKRSYYEHQAAFTAVKDAVALEL